MKILVAGASGLIGKALVESLAFDGHCIVATHRSGSAPAGCFRTYRWSLSDPVDPEMFEGVEVVVHAIHDLTAQEFEIVEGVGRFQEQARRAGVPRQIFLSSLSSDHSSSSPYGRQKSILERKFQAHAGSIIVRPGLVVGPGGVFGRLQAALRRWPIFPVIDHGKSLVSFIGLDVLIGCLKSMIVSPSGLAEYNLFYAQPIAFAELLRVVARINGWRRILLNMPSGWILLGLRLCEFFRLPLPIRKENVLGLRQNSRHPYTSSLSHFSLPELTFEVCYGRNLG